MGKILIKAGTIVTMNPKGAIIKGDILIEGNEIKEIGQNIRVEDAFEINAEGKVVIPGLIQSHIHLTQTLFRGQADDLELMDWLKNRVWPLEASHTEESNYISAKLGIAELIKGGTTSIIDMETVNHTDLAFQAIFEGGIRAIAGKCMMDYGKAIPNALMEDTQLSIVKSVELLKKWHGKANGRVQYAFAPRFVVCCSEELLIKVRDLSKEYGVMVHTHASENRGEIDIVERDRGMRNINYLHHIGLTGEKLILAHCIWLEEEEMWILADTGTKIAHCPNSNLKLASGIAKIPELLKMGANISIGADGAPCNNNLDMFKEMRSAALIQKARLLSPTAMPAQDVFNMATLGGAKAMGMEDRLGSLEVGKIADIVLVDLKTIATTPNSNVDVISQLVYSASGTDVETTIVDGNILMLNRKLQTLREEEIMSEANRILEKQVRISGIRK